MPSYWISTLRPVEVLEKVAGTKSHENGTGLDALHAVAKNDK